MRNGRLIQSAILVAALAVACLGVGAGIGYADSITEGTFNFTVTSGSPRPTGSFVYDDTTSAFTSFTVDWDGAVFDFSFEGITLALLDSTGTWCAAAPGNTSGTCLTSHFNLDEVYVPPEAPFSYTNLFAAAAGTYTLTETPVAAPEPSSVLLLGEVLLVGVGLLGWQKKRLAASRRLIHPLP